MDQRDVFLADPSATARLGERLAVELLSLEPADRLLLLRGQLGAGKTSLVQGLASGLGIDEPVTSPTFALAQHYQGCRGEALTHLVHLDLYRLEGASAADLYRQEEEEALALGAVLAVEWPERLPFLPAGAWWLDLEPEAEGRRARLFRAP
ncbi:tRNA (adenosine(37)-N6)-threonylcarbamoyltransferase complex ATPase subunit type 1 TsaE [Cyanobium sp. ATX 6F1]|uniref:tRNA (adenosine(37)-N6)-threonylcarbamoyltransferase complex ATPase subunit type 1 TsaE n=1 Tax=unclassified Cyanobium TaxID=2627006 RepID=UPI0020CD7A2D|nr:tRNA (adenosine(37)-N6)-threonylcarbamoyltransferase complex ATPase subunit type 1 TsaE [Cyanobium sp. ATX 6F1]MCP9916759.1 tRNA (adenosine(37)-N6)-threonylcarbamoyltransferase complex ATPase subunit type 1 TsaE [Cyanobium sp. ATX 6F1]